MATPQVGDVLICQVGTPKIATTVAELAGPSGPKALVVTITAADTEEKTFERALHAADRAYGTTAIEDDLLEMTVLQNKTEEERTAHPVG